MRKRSEEEDKEGRRLGENEDAAVTKAAESGSLFCLLTLLDPETQSAGAWGPSVAAHTHRVCLVVHTHKAHTLFMAELFIPSGK